MKKLLALVLAAMLPVLTLAGCISTNNKTQGEDTRASVQTTAAVKGDVPEYLNMSGELPIAKDLINLKMTTIRPTNGGQADELWYFKWTEQKANIKFDVKQIEAAAWAQQKNVLFASGDLPDVFLNCNFSTDDIVRFGQVEGRFLELNTFIDKYGPNIKDMFAKYPEAKGVMTSLDGKIYSLGFVVGDKPLFNTSRPWMHVKWLENLGMEPPETVDDFIDVLKAFKEKDPNRNGKADEIPWVGSWSQGYPEGAAIQSAYGMPVAGNGAQLFVKDGKLAMNVLEPAYEEYLKTMNYIFSNGLIDKDLFTQTDVQATAKTSQGLAGFAVHGSPFLMDPVNWKDYAAFKPLTSKLSPKPVWQGINKTNTGQFAIIKGTKHPEALMKLADMYFTLEGSVAFWYGPQDGSEMALGVRGWFVKDGVLGYEYTEKAKNMWDYQCYYMNPINGYKLGLTGHLDRVKEAYHVDFKTDERDEYFLNEMAKILDYTAPAVPPLYFTKEDVDKKAQLETAISDYVNIMEAKFITGAEPLANYKSFVEQVKKLGAEELLAINQKSYEAFLEAAK